MAQYPSAVKVFTTKIDLNDVVFAAHINELQDEVVALQTILGTSPQGGSSTVKDRIAAVETGKASSTHTHGAGDITSGSFGVARGGTGVTTLAVGGYLVGNGTSAVTTKTPAQVLSDIGAAATGHNHDADYAPLAAREQFQSFSREGTLQVATGKHRLIFPWNVTLLGAKLAVGTAPTGASILVDVNKNGTTVFSTQSNRPSIPAGSNLSALATTQISGTSVTTSDYVTVDIDQVGSTAAGADLTVILSYRRA